MLTHPRLVLTALALLGAGALVLAATPRPGGGGYEELLALFREWREFQQPRLVDGVPDYTPGAMAAQRERLPELQRRLLAIDTSGWPVARRVDWFLVRAEMHGLEFDHRALRPWSRNPAFYSTIVAEQSDTPSKEGPAFAGAIELWRHPLPLPASELPALRQGLRAIPRILDEARGNLVEDARDLWLLGIRAHKGQAALLAGLARDLGRHHPELVADAEAARQAEDAFVAWLEAELPRKHGPSGVGIESYDWYLKHVHLVPYTWQDELTLMHRELQRALARLAVARERNRSLPALEAIATAGEWQRRQDAAVTEYVAFLRDHQVMSVPDYLEPALRARTAAFVAAAERDFFAQVDAREPLLLRSHGNHWFDLARMEREPHQSPVRRGPLLYNIWDSRAEGVATAMEELTANAGLYQDRPRSLELVDVMIAQRAARAISSLRMHANQFSLEQAVEHAHVWTPYGWLKRDGELVWGEQGLYLEQPGYGTCYLTGKALFEKLLAERARQLGDGFSLKRFMDELNASGLIPVSMIRWELLGSDDEARGFE